jgi:hypothetical protein
MLAIILTSPPHFSQVSISILKTRFNLFAQVIEAHFSAGVWLVPSGDWVFLHLPRLAGVTSARYLLLGANTPLKVSHIAREVRDGAGQLGEFIAGWRLDCKKREQF